jgi:hypothetical protein
MAVPFVGKQLNQLRPANTNAVSIHSPTANTHTHVTTITVCNTTAGGAKFRIFLDDDGTTYDQTTALYYDITLAANSTQTFEFQKPIFMNDSNGNLAVRTDTASALTFTVWGVVLNV